VLKAEMGTVPPRNQSSGRTIIEQHISQLDFHIYQRKQYAERPDNGRILQSEVKWSELPVPNHRKYYAEHRLPTTGFHSKT
jgi:hypothetical protein